MYQKCAHKILLLLPWQHSNYYYLFLSLTSLAVSPRYPGTEFLY